MKATFRWSFVFLMGQALAACGPDDSGHCVRTVCQAGEAPVCAGFDVRRCAADGARWEVTSCGAQERCSDGQCVARVCTTPGVATCTTPERGKLCLDDASGFQEFTCSAGDRCVDGACLPGSCGVDERRCTSGGLAHCVSGRWETSACAPGEVCVAGEGEPGCRAPICVPGRSRCDGAIAVHCDARGRSAVREVCDEVCRQGVCQAPLCGEEEEGDTVDSSDTTEESSLIRFAVDGATITLDQSAKVIFDGGTRALIASARKDSRLLELRFSPANVTLTGSYSSEIFNPVKVTVCYHDGVSATGTFTQCGAGFTHESTTYQATITRNDGRNGRFEADFSATLRDKNTDTLSLRDGFVRVTTQ